MKKVEIKIGNEVFPCRQTMGAMLRFKQETGREVTEIDATSFTDICTFLWCCIVSASACKSELSSADALILPNGIVVAIINAIINHAAILFPFVLQNISIF